MKRPPGGRAARLSQVRIAVTALTIVFVLHFSPDTRAMDATPETAQPLRPVPFTQVHVTGGFWGPRVQTTITHTLEHCLQQCEETGRLANFDRAAGVADGAFEGYYFNDSDVYKVLEGAAYALYLRDDPELRQRVLEIIRRIAAAQQPDGYLNSYYILHPELQRWSDIRNKHELYCAGHLLEAGIAMKTVAGEDTLLYVALRNVALIDSLFGPGKRSDPPGHQEIELAIIRLARELDDRRYLPLARFFLEQRGNADGHELYGEYSQDHLPLAEQTAIVGHAVRAAYMLTAACDLPTVDPSYDLPASINRIWRDTVGTKMYVTGGIGPSSQNEGFTVAYDLPNETAYAETCASIAMVLWNHRLYLLTGDAKYLEVLERTLYNGVLSGISLSGDRYFYTNPLASRGQHERRPWYECACCPPNLLRTLASVGRFAYAVSDDGIYANLYMNSTAELPLAGDASVTIHQATEYPWQGKVALRIELARPKQFTLHLRIPPWCHGASVAVNGDSVAAARDARGYAKIDREWRSGDTVALHMPLEVRRVIAHSQVTNDRGRVALQRGPIVYCLEGVDHDADIHRMILPSRVRLTAEHRPGLLGGVTVLRGEGLLAPDEGGAWDEPLYRDAVEPTPTELTAVPYYAWQNRGRSDMLVWIAESAAALPPGPVSWVTASASHCYQSDSPEALHDRLIPIDSLGAGLPRFTWWPRKGSVEWVQYEFDEPREVDGAAVYWFADAGRGGGCDAPANWRVLWRDGGEWKPVADVGEYGLALDEWNEVCFRRVMTDGLRIEATLPDGTSAGILEWRVLSQAVAH